MTDDAEREARFEAIDRFRAALPPYDEEEVLADATEAVDAVRREKAADRDVSHPSAAPPDGEMGGEAPCQLNRFWDVDDE